jgi:hypothetical protein
MSRMDLTEPPPPVPSISLIKGRPSSPAIFSASICFSMMAASAAPPRTVKSSATTATGRPRTVPRPKMQLAGEKPSKLALCICARLAGERADFPKTARIEQKVHPFPHVEPPCALA